MYKDEASQTVGGLGRPMGRRPRAQRVKGPNGLDFEFLSLLSLKKKDISPSWYSLKKYDLNRNEKNEG